MEVIGQLFFRDTELDAPNNSNKKLMIVVGVVAVSKDTRIRGEHQYTVVGSDDNLVIGHMPNDLRPMSLALCADGLLHSPIWRC